LIYFPVLAGSALADNGLVELLDAIIQYLPSPQGPTESVMHALGSVLHAEESGLPAVLRVQQQLLRLGETHKVCVVVDDLQTVSDQGVLENLRMLLNVEVREERVLSLILCGQERMLGHLCTVWGQAKPGALADFTLAHPIIAVLVVFSLAIGLFFAHASVDGRIILERISREIRQANEIVTALPQAPGNPNMPEPREIEFFYDDLRRPCSNCGIPVEKEAAQIIQDYKCAMWCSSIKECLGEKVYELIEKIKKEQK